MTPEEYQMLKSKMGGFRAKGQIAHLRGDYELRNRMFKLYDEIALAITRERAAVRSQ